MGAWTAAGATAGARMGAGTASGAMAAAGANAGACTVDGAGAGTATLAEDTGSSGPVVPLSPTTPNEQAVPLLTYTLQGSKTPIKVKH